MLILTRYTLSHFRRFFLLSLGSFSGLYLLIEFFERADNLARRNAELSKYVIYFSCRIPLIVTQVVPLAVLMGVFMTIGTLSRNNELTAMRACGMSLSRISIPLLTLGLAISLMVLATNEWLVPVTTRQANHVYRIENNAPQKVTMARDKVWLKDGAAIINIRMILPEQQLLQGISIQELDDAGRPVTRIDAEKATYSNGLWQGEKITTTHFDITSGEVREVVTKPAGPLPLSKGPEDFKTVTNRSEELGIVDLIRMTQRVRDEGYDPTRYEVDLQGHLATPFASLIMAFLGIPFALQRGRGSNLAVGIAISVVIGIAYHLLQGMMLALGYSGTIPIALAAWSPNVLFGLLGVTLLGANRQ